MEYDVEQLMPIVAKLTEQYTSKESSSVTYETARELMGAVVYCIEEYMQSRRNGLVQAGEARLNDIYLRGRELVVEKVRDARALYEEIINEFEDYGCKNYKSTILDGIPEFFLRYDYKFRPQDHLLTLDYPILIPVRGKSGADLIFAYLYGISMEQRLLTQFDPAAVRRVLECYMPGYGSFYMDNICLPVLYNMLGCLIADRPVHELYLSREDLEEIKFYFEDSSAEQTEWKLKRLIEIFAEQSKEEQMGKYLRKAAPELTVRIRNGIENDSPDAMFSLITG